MNKIYFLLLVICVLTSCGAPNEALKKERAKWEFSSWKEKFKDYTLCTCLLKGYENKDLVNGIRSIDRSFSSPINYAFFDSAANAYTRPVIAKLKLDSINSIGKVAENGAGKNVFAECLHFYKSAKLDSLANIESKKWEKIKSIDSVINNKIPAY